ncbi:MAG: hypothetical protein ACE364_00570 [Chlorobiota bacterium]
MTHLDRFIDSLTEEDFINAYPGSLELLLDESGKGLEVCKYIQKNVPSISLYIGNVSKFHDKLQEYMKGKEHEMKKVALDMRISEQSLLRAIKKNRE